MAQAEFISAEHVQSNGVPTAYAVSGVPGPSPSFGGVVGLAAVFCGVTNCLLSTILLAAELFGGEVLPLFALAAAVSYRLSGYTGLYSEQEIVYAKHIPREIDKKAE